MPASARFFTAHKMSTFSELVLVYSIRSKVWIYRFTTATFDNQNPAKQWIWWKSHSLQRVFLFKTIPSDDLLYILSMKNITRMVLIQWLNSMDVFLWVLLFCSVFLGEKKCAASQTKPDSTPPPCYPTRCKQDPMNHSVKGILVMNNNDIGN